MEDVLKMGRRDLADDGVPICPDEISRQRPGRSVPTRPGRPAAHDVGSGRNAPPSSSRPS